ncbi:class I SAM-dependent methyltransferase [Methylomonas sp. SURF-2]|uniref:Class I SAM-dependent methyltransferase n=1 Tax=Methylomonas subterranea TaxID=2952225 RepID=A0ABT1TH87_9GAMM|nr:DUF938 domain-containing protein [Methylomonas sp. SURF-2]MCQ8104818.1 class I SAM-dependent methyltransferase [Methylomonas sp. SURF-2]
MTTEKPFSQACENNKQAILDILKQVFDKPATVWEIGSGTGQHACHFAQHLPHLTWQPTDRAGNIAGIRLWLGEAGLSNLQAPLMLDVADADWPCDSVDALFTANTLHIMSLREVELLFERLARYLALDARVCIYGPFNYRGGYTSDSNARFDQWLKQQNPHSCIKHFERIRGLASAIGLELLADHAMPANNRLLVFQRQTRRRNHAVGFGG